MLSTGKDFIIYGSYAQKLKELSDQYNLFSGDSEKTINIFERNIDVFILAPIIGLISDRFIESSVESDEDKFIKRTINFSQLSKEKKKIDYISNLLMLYSDRLDMTYEERANKIFKDKDEETIKMSKNLYIGYMRGGIDVLYENILENSANTLDIYLKLYDFIADYKYILKDNILKKDDDTKILNDDIEILDDDIIRLFK